MKEVTKIPLNSLSSDDVRELTAGLVVSSREDMLRALEGMQSR